MILVRLVFQAKFGHAAEVVAGFKQGGEIARSAGVKGPRHVRILTDLSGPFDTVVQELEFDSLDDFMKSQAAMFADPRWQEMARNGGLGIGWSADRRNSTPSSSRSRTHGVGSLLTRSPEVGISPPATWKERGTVMKTIGVLGGLGPQATMDFEARVHAAAQRLIPQRASQA